MAYTARELISDAFHLSGVVSRDFQTVTGSQSTEGLKLLNNVLAGKRSQERLIPYFKEYNLTAVAGQEEYFIPNLALIETFTFNIDTIRYATRQDKRGTYFATGRVDNIQSLPYSWHTERTKGGSNLYIYFIPNEAYPMTVWGKFALDKVDSLDEDLELVYDLDYLDYLQYYVAKRICHAYGISLPPDTNKEFMRMENILTDDSPLDLQMKKESTLSGRTQINYGDVNLGQGWTVPNS